MTRREIIGKNIHKLRKSLGMNQVEFGDAIGRSQSVIAQYEKGSRMPSTLIISEIANIFGVTYDSIYCSDEEMAEKDSGDWYGEYFGYADEPAERQEISLSPEEVYLIRCYREAEPSARTYALQMLENNPSQKKDRA